MQATVPHEWLYPPSYTEAGVIQNEIAKRVIVEDQFEKIERVGGVDLSHNLFDKEEIVFGAVVTLEFPSLQLVERVCERRRHDFPYIPGLLGFREAPVLVEAFQKLESKPQIIFVDGHGIAHPRGLGIASHLGVLLDCPSIGVAKSILVGKSEKELGSEPGDHVPLLWKGKKLGVLLRTKRRCNPLIISTGHRVSLSTAISLVMKCCQGYRLPETTRQAHLAANEFRRENKGS